VSRILVVALNPALDITHEVAGVDWSGVNRPAAVSTRPGGKGLNVGRTLHSLGADVLVIGLLGGPAGDAVLAGLASAGVPGAFTAFTAIAAETRRTFAVVDAARRQTALFNEPGPWVSPDEYSAFLASFGSRVKSCAAVVLSGSLPQGLPQDTYARLAAVAAAASVPVVLDADGQALVAGIAARPAIVKPNLAELESAVGRPLRTGLSGARRAEDAAIVAAARELRTAGAAAVVVSLGADGLLAVTGDGVWRATPPGGIAGNPTGAGDAVVAGLAYGLARGDSWPERLRHATALGAATAAAPVAGEFGRAAYVRALDEVKLTRIEAA
jgi:tagatose 6-phosphate kinase